MFPKDQLIYLVGQVTMDCWHQRTDKGNESSIKHFFKCIFNWRIIALQCCVDS